MLGKNHIAKAASKPAKALAALALCAMLLPLAAGLAACSGADKAAQAAGDAASSALGGGTQEGETSGSAFKPSFHNAGFNAKKAEGDGDASIDVSSAADGYVCAKAKSSAKLKFQVTLGNQSYNYNLPGDGTPIVCPLNMGDGSYRFSILQNTSGNRYATLYSTQSQVEVDDKLAPYLIPSVFCPYTKKSSCVAKAAELTGDAQNQGDALQAIYNYVVSNIDYDKDKAAELAGGSGYIPDPDSTLASKKGICLDYASLVAAMLRSQGIPCKIVTGYVSTSDVYHAWNMVYIDGTWTTVDIDVESRTWTRLDPTLAAAGSLPTVGDGSSYTDRYQY